MSSTKKNDTDIKIPISWLKDMPYVTKADLDRIVERLEADLQEAFPVKTEQDE